MLDLKILGAEVLDGTGAPSRRTDVGIRGDTIAALGALAEAAARTTLDLRPFADTPSPRHLLAPGFVDAHSHSDVYLLIEPCSPSKITQGITTEVVGNCGASAAPRLGAYRLPSDWADKELPAAWSTVREYRALLEQAGPAVNVVLLTGHNALRAGVMGYQDRAATPDELRRMKRALADAMDEGSSGLSTGLIYAPGLFAATEEIVALAGVVAGRGGIYTSHMRSEGGALPAAVAEALEVGRRTGVRVEISHLKAGGRANWPLADRAMELIRAAREAGLTVCADRYPYTSGCTELDVVFPAWAAEGGREATLARLRDSGQRSRLRDDLLSSRPDEEWDGIVIGSTSHPDNFPFRGRPLPEVAEILGLHPAEAILVLTERDELRTGAFFFGMSEENLFRILAEPYVLLGTDASLRATDGPLSLDYPHPRAYGSFPRFLRLSLDGKTVPLPEAVRKMTSLPAEQFGLADRGVIAEGKHADLVVFDRETVRDVSTYADPHRYSDGIRHVIVNGVPALRDGRLTGDRAGRVLS